MTWADWIRLTGDIFAMTDRRDDGVLAAWSRVLAGQGVTTAEAADAVNWLAENDPPAFRQAVLPAIQSRLRAASAEQTARESSEAHEGPQCTLCANTGMVHAADMDAHRDGRYREIVVYCRCPLGKWKRSGMIDHLREKKGQSVHLWDVDAYDAVIEWVDVSTGEVWSGGEARRRMLADMRKRLGAELDAAAKARGADHSMGRLPAPFRQALDRARGARP